MHARTTSWSDLYRGARTRRVLAGAVGTLMLALSLSIGAAAVPAAAHAETRCGQAKYRDARTSTRFSQIGAVVCFQINGTRVQAVGSPQVSNPLTCPVICNSPQPVQYRAVNITVTSGTQRKTCSTQHDGVLWFFTGAGCAIDLGSVPGRKSVAAQAQACFDVQDDGKPFLCIDASFSTPV